MNTNQALGITGSSFPKFRVLVASDRVRASTLVLGMETVTSADVSFSVLVPPKAERDYLRAVRYEPSAQGEMHV